MKKQKGVLSSLVFVLSLSVLLAGCGNNGNNENSANSTNSANSSDSTPSAAPEDSTQSAATPDASKKPEAPTKLELIKVGYGTKLPAAGDDFVKQALDQKLNMDLTITAPASFDDFRNQLNTRIAAGDYPDIMELDSTSTLQMLAEKGALLDLTPYLDQLSDVKKMVGEDGFKKGMIDGKTYAIAKAPSLQTSAYYIRKDWLDKLKLNVPTTSEELLKVAQAFTEDDPDGNGKKDTFGISGTGWQAFSPIFGSFGVPTLDVALGVYIEDGKIVTPPQDPNMKAALAETKKYFDAGVVDPEVFANQGTAASDKGIKGQAGIVYTDWNSFVRKEGADKVKAANPNAEWVMIPTITGQAGPYAGAVDIGGASGYVALPKTLEKDENKLHKIIQLLNYVSLPEGSQLVQFGIKDKDFTVDGDKVKITELGAQEAGYVWLYQITGRPEAQYLATKFDYAASAIQQGAQLDRLKLYNSFITLPSDFNSADAYRYIGDEAMQIVYGKKPVDSFDSLAADLNRKFNYNLFLDQANKQLKELGYLQ